MRRDIAAGVTFVPGNYGQTIDIPSEKAETAGPPTGTQVRQQRRQRASVHFIPPQGWDTSSSFSGLRQSGTAIKR